jgi:hypothetical protein
MQCQRRKCIVENFYFSKTRHIEPRNLELSVPAGVCTEKLGGVALPAVLSVERIEFEAGGA